jgi:phytanoyl-CoA hydroxylase
MSKVNAMTERAQAYQRDGYLVVPSLLSAAVVGTLQRATDALEQVACSFDVDTKVDGVFFEMQSASGRKREPAVVRGALRKITGPSKWKGDVAFAKLKRDARVLAVVQELGVVGARCVVDQVNFKHPRVGTGFPYHQDAAFVHGDARDRLQHFGGINVVIALDAADADNGGFAVLGGTHQHGLMRDQHGYDTSTTNEGVFDEGRKVIPSLQPGDAIFFHPLLAHGSGLNLSDRRRRLVTMWFVGGAPA